jgi:hypothetical protein
MKATPAAAHSPIALNRTAQTLLDQGYVVLRSIVPPDQVARINQELTPHYAATPRCIGDFHGWKTTRMGSVLTKAPSARALVLHEAVWPAVESILKPACDFVQLNLMQALLVHPGERAQVPHRDEEMWPCEKGGVPWLINVMWSLSDFSAENGATRIWPGSHRSVLDRAADPSSSIAAEMPAGSACLFMGSVTHGAGANRTASDRAGIIVSYCLGWLKTYENQYLAYPPNVARAFSPELQALIGYRMHRPNLGSWNGQDPAVLLRDHDDHAAFEDALPPEIVEELRAYYAAA